MSGCEQPQNLVDVIRRRAANFPEHCVFTFLERGEMEAGRLNYARLHRAATNSAVNLLERAVPGTRVLLLFPPGQRFIEAFFGCLYAGMQAVPAPPPRSALQKKRLHHLAHDAGVGLVLVPPEGEAAVAPYFADLVLVDRGGHDETRDLTEPVLTPDTTAFIQYTSGSTGKPKGVMVSHANILANLEVIGGPFPSRPVTDEVQVNWLPFYHDMGLIFGVLLPVFRGMHCYLMSPSAFVQRPLRWLAAISRYRATHAAAPDFAYARCAAAAEAGYAGTLDLKHWRTAYNGAEVVRPATMDTFIRTFAPHGFRARAFCPAYGLAEATLKVTAVSPETRPAFRHVDREALVQGELRFGKKADARYMTVVGCGRPAPNHRILIVHPENGERLVDRIGEVWVSGPSVARGYYHREEETRHVFHARTADEDGPFLRTGDLGFLEGGELFVTGRIKDLIIINGRNHHPADLETDAASAHVALRPETTACFALEAEAPQLIVAAEISRGQRAGLQASIVADAVAETLAANHGLALAKLLLLRPGKLPRTTSGKIRRNGCRRDYENGTLKIWQEITPGKAKTAAAGTTSPFLPMLIQALAEVLGLEPGSIDPAGSPASLGLDSVAAAGLETYLADRYGRTWPARRFLEAGSLIELAEMGGEAVVPEPEFEAVEGRFPLTPAQQSLWPLYRQDPHNPAWHLALALRIHPPHHIEILAAALRILQDRHPSLRTVYDEQDGVPYQHAGPVSNRFPQFVGAADWKESALQARLAREQRRPFNLKNGEVFRAVIFSRPRGEHVLLLTAHHLAADFHSLELLTAELGSVYKAYSEARPLPFGRASSPAAFGEVQQDLSVDEAARRYWQQRLVGPVPSCFESLKAKPPKPSGKVHHAQFRLNGQTVLAYKRLARAHETTLHRVLLTAFQVFLHRLTGADRVRTATPVNCRGRRFRNQVGYLVNTILRQADFRGNPSFRAYLEESRRILAADEAHAGYPIAAFAAASGSDFVRYHTMFCFYRAEALPALGAAVLGIDGLPLKCGPLSCSTLGISQSGAQLDLGLSAALIEEELAMVMDVDGDLFDAADVDLFARFAANLFNGIAAEPEATVGNLPLLDEAARNSILAATSPGMIKADRDPSEMLLKVADQQPDRIALITPEGQWSYRALHEKARQLAAELHLLGVGPETVVGVLAGRGEPLIRALLSNLMVGSVFFPLDPTMPKQRLSRLLQQARPFLVLVEDAHLNLLPAGTPTLYLNNENPPTDQLPGNYNRLPRASAWLLFTSGSTGTPKGVLVSRAAVTRHMAAFTAVCPLRSEHRALLYSSPMFDVFFEEVLPTLTAGATVVAPNEASRRDPGLLAELIRRHRVTHANLPASFWHAWVDYLETSETAVPESLKVLIVGSEPVRADLIARWRVLSEHPIQVINGYGQTETTITATVHRLDPCDEPIAPVGKPLPDTSALVCDRYGNPMPPGQSGELVIGGERLARGYLNRPAETAAVFLPDPFSKTPGARIYRSGDRMTMRREDRTLVFLGRMDRQLELRGHRVEPAEIEAVLMKNPSVSNAVAAMIDNQLTAWLETSQHDLDTAALRDLPASQLPHYMVPVRFITLERFPRTPSGKIDTAALPRPRMENAGEPPRGDLEKALAGLWSDLLNREGIGRESDFFQMGGHSLTAVRLVARIEQNFGVAPGLTAVYNHPRLDRLAAHIGSLQKAGFKNPTLPDIQPRPADSPVPLNPLQQELWLHHRRFSGDADAAAAFNMPLRLEISGDLDIRGLSMAWFAVMARHEILRTCYQEVDGEPFGFVQPADPRELSVTDLSGLPESESRAIAANLAQIEARKAFDLNGGPPLRRRVLMLGKKRYLHLVTLHHIACDGWTLDLISRELAQQYFRATSYLITPSPTPPALQFGDIAAWLSNETVKTARAEKLSWWRKHLDRLPPLLELPVNRPSPATRSFRAGRLPFHLDETETKRCMTLAAETGVTLFSVLSAGFAVFLARACNREDITFATLTAGRTRPEMEIVPGPFINTVVLRHKIPARQATVRDLLHQVQTGNLNALRNGDVHFSDVVRALKPERNTAYAPLVQVLLVLQNAPLPKVELPDLSVHLDGTPTHTTRFDLTLDLSVEDGCLQGAWEYRADLFDLRTIETFAMRLRELLRHMALAPEQPVSDLDGMTDAERERLLADWHAPPVDNPELETPYRLVARIAEEMPDAVAVRTADDPQVTVTYEALLHHAQGVAVRLQSLGAGPEDLVGLCIDRSPDLVAGLLGILAAGCGYVPLDPSYPDYRLKTMLEDSGARLLLTTEDLESRFDPDQVNRVTMESIIGGGNPKQTTGLENTAYVIYTSGSTGKPKGVRVAGLTVCRFLRGIQQVLGFRRGDVCLALSTICFDVSVQDIFLTLTTGGSLLQVSDAVARDGRRLKQVLDWHRPDFMQATPATWRMLTEAGWTGTDGLRVMSGGEALTPELATHLPAGNGALLNLFGPTETTVWASARWVAPEDADRVPIGKPLTGVRLTICDASGRLTPPGTRGELAVGGDHVTRGYHNRPALTAERFVPDPYSPIPGARRYMTGDLVRLATGETPDDTTIHFLGRSDHQVKIRGFRVEIGEVEAVLNQAPGVARGVILVSEITPGDRSLEAFVAPFKGQPFSESSVRAFMKTILPDYMLPRRFVPIDKIPLTHNGKLDRRALTAMDTAPDQTNCQRRPACLFDDPGEQLLAAIWSDILDRKDIAPEDDFFSLGGHSLLVARVLSRIQDAFGVDLPPPDLFNEPTVRGLARRIAELRDKEATPRSSPTPGVRPAFVPLSPQQQRLFLMNELMPLNGAYNIPLALHLRGGIDATVLETALYDLVCRHEILRTAFCREQGQVLQRAVGPLKRALVLVERLGETPQDVIASTASWFARPFNTAEAPLWRAALIRLGFENHLLVFSIHHLIADGWSLYVLVRDLFRLYEARLGMAPAPAPAGLQYADYTLWKREDARCPAHCLDWWRQNLSEVSGQLPVPTDFPVPEQREMLGRTLAFSLNASILQGLERAAGLQTTTLFMVLQAAFSLLLARHGRNEEIVTATAFANRKPKEIEDLIGFFVNTLPLKVRYRPEQSFGELLGDVRETILGAFEHGALAFEDMIAALRPERKPGRLPLAQISFTFHGAPMPVTEPRGLSVRQLDVDTGRVRFDLEVDLWREHDGIRGGFTYAIDLFSDEHMESLAACFHRLVEGIAEDPTKPCASYDLLTQEERRNLLTACASQTDYLPNRSLHAQFLDIAGRRTEAEALYCGDRVVSYGELDRRSAALAGRLVELGAGPEQVVGLCLPPSPDLIIGLLAILRAGAAYLPLNVMDPTERLCELLRDTGARLVIADENTVGIPAAFAGVVINPSEEGRAPLTEPEIDPDHLAYVIYTSGSTGKPKGVGVSHASVDRLFQATQARFQFSSGDTWTLFHGITFDFSVWELWGALLYGGRLVLAPFETSRDPRAFAQLVSDCQVTILNQTPTAFRQLSPYLHPEKVPNLRLIIFGGETLDEFSLKSWFDRFSADKPQLVNMYGITETCVHVTWKLIRPDNPSASIGHSLPHQSLYLLDPHLKPVPRGAVGEIYVGGAGPTRGYTGQPGLTARCFIPNPYPYEQSEDPTCQSELNPSPKPMPSVTANRLYKTGDLGRWAANGALIYLGRCDDQIQLRGHRIEPGEITGRLMEHPDLGDAIVTTIGDRAETMFLAAFLVPDPKRAPVASQLARLTRAGRFPESARQTLPNGMVLLHDNPVETQFLYREIFADAAYYRHGIRLEKGARVVDVGAHIGMASLFFAMQVEDVELVCLEPIPTIRETLQANMDLYQLNARVIEAAAGAEPGDADLTWYPNVSVISGCYADQEEERQVVAAWLRQAAGEHVLKQEDLDDLTAGRLQPRHFKGRMTTISQIIREYRLETIDLLKIDAEKSEWDILCGIQPEDWPRIRQLVIEVHDLDGRLARITALLEARGFNLTTEQNRELADTNLFNVYAIRTLKDEGTQLVTRPPYAWRAGHRLAAEARRHLQSLLPSYMIPSQFVVLDRLPLTTNGKLDRKALGRLTEKTSREVDSRLCAGEIEHQVSRLWSELIQMDGIDPEANFFDVGGHSVLLVALASRIRESLDPQIGVTDLLRHTTIRAQARLIEQRQRAESESEPVFQAADSESPDTKAVAIIGFSGRFPGAPNVAAFWENLCAGIESITRLDTDALRAAGVNDTDRLDPNYVPACALIEDIDYFDAAFFGIGAREAELMDPQHRLFLEAAWEALEHAGYAAPADRRKAGIFASVGAGGYREHHLAPAGLDRAEPQLTGLGNEREFLPTRIAYKLGFQGPALNIQTACSSSMVAVHTACRALRQGECELALAGGVSLVVPHGQGYRYDPGLVFSPDGHCRAFDAGAQGTVPGSGLALLVLKPLAAALADGDTIHAVIEGSAINNDGSARAGYTAPGGQGQETVIEAALRDAGRKPADIGFIEAHGTGTPLGDSVEVAALTEVFRKDSVPGKGVTLGSVKTNLGHLDAASGVTGLLKAALAVKHGLIPPSLHFTHANPETGLETGPFRVNGEPLEWDSPQRVAGVSSFGIGGTNAHVIVASPPQPEPEELGRNNELILLSAKTEAALQHQAERLAAWLQEQNRDSFADAAHTLRVGREAFPYRRALICSNRDEAVTRLRAGGPIERVNGSPRVAFLFPGQGNRLGSTAAALYTAEPAFRERLDRCLDKLQPYMDLDVRSLVLGEDKDHRLMQTLYAQPVLFATSYALAETWMSWGVKPDALLGHSLGEFTAAAIAGVFGFEDALALVCKRARLMEDTQPGAMSAVPLHADAVLERLTEGVCLAAVNAHDRCVVSGDEKAIANFIKRLAGEDIECRLLPVKRAFHSGLMEEAARAFADEIALIDLRPPSLPIISCITGKPVDPREIAQPEYWRKQMLQPVQFCTALDSLFSEGPLQTLEVGPGRTLSGLVSRHRPGGRPAPVPSAVGTNPARSLAGAVSSLWSAGVALDWQAFVSGQNRRRIPLPAYPFERVRFWIEASKPGEVVSHGIDQLQDWLSIPGLQRAPEPRSGGKPCGRGAVLIFGRPKGPGRALAEWYRAHQRIAVLVEPGDTFEKTGPNKFQMNPGFPKDFDRLIARLSATGRLPDRLVHLWCLGDDEEESTAETLALGFYSLIHLAKALGRESGGDCRLTVVTSGCLDVTGQENLKPLRACLLGPVKVLPVEYQGFSARLIDWGETFETGDIDRLTAELTADEAPPVLARRGRYRWLPTHVAAPEPSDEPVFRVEGVYMITGASGAVARALADYLARSYRARLVLLSRTEIAPTVRQRLEQTGGRVMSIQADVTHGPMVKQAVEDAVAEFGRLDGVIHTAGIPGGATIQGMKPEEARAVLAPKVTGTLALAGALTDVPLDFMVLCSSLTGVLGGFGQASYCAANAFLDAFAVSNPLPRCRRLLSIGWDAWKNEGMAVRAAAAFPHMPGDLDHGLDGEQGARVLESALAVGCPHVLVATLSLDVMQAAWNTLDPRRSRESGPIMAEAADEDADTGKRLAAIWCHTLGLTSVGPDDDFFDLGGDSLIGARLFARIQEEIGITLPPSALYEHTTIRQQTGLIRSMEFLEEEPVPIEQEIQMEQTREWGEL
ncbi:MAG: amino acid adenylation domain-containing protein [Acidobacteriota bacterium]|nr:amino acid adenylation domain-containing protein [Acidobacteriota bacterium]